MNKKAAWEWEQIGKLIIAIALLIILILFIMALKGKGLNLLEKLKDIVRFGR